MTIFPKSRNIVHEIFTPFSIGGVNTDDLYKIIVLSTSQLKRTPDRANSHADIEIRTELTAMTSGCQIQVLKSKVLPCPKKPHVCGGLILVCPTGICIDCGIPSRDPVVTG